MTIHISLMIASAYVAFAGIFLNAYTKTGQFYPAAVYIMRSSTSSSVVYFVAGLTSYGIFLLVRRLFFGELRRYEDQNMRDRVWTSFVDISLMFTAFREDISISLITRFMLLISLKALHSICEDRIDLIDRSPVICRRFHIQNISVLVVLDAINSYLLWNIFENIIRGNTGSNMVLGYEHALLFQNNLQIALKYSILMYDRYREQAWDDKTLFLLYIELFNSAFDFLVNFAFAAIMIRMRYLPFYSIRPTVYSIRNMHKAFSDIVQYQKALTAMESHFTNVTREELEGIDATCIICREEMVPESQPKRLPCSHVFHSHCLRSWFQRQQRCPTCRADILTNAEPNRPGAARARRVRAAVQNRRVRVRFVARQNAAQNETNGSRAVAAILVPATRIEPQDFPTPPHPHPFPAPPADIGMTSNDVDELLAAQDNTVENIRLRLQKLKNIQVLLDAAEAQFSDYTSATRTSFTDFSTTKTNQATSTSDLHICSLFGGGDGHDELPRPSTSASITAENHMETDVEMPNDLE